MNIIIAIIITLNLFRWSEADYSFSPGETSPQNIEIAVNGSFTIYCSINPSMFNGRNASDLYFVNEKTQMKVSKNYIRIENATTIIYEVQHAVAQQTTYVCKCGFDSIMGTKVYVGTKPIKVNNFLCLIYYFRDMICNFTQPENYVLTRYNLTFHIKTYERTYTPDCNYDRKPLVTCNSTVPHSHERKTYVFELRAENSLGVTKQTFQIKHLDVIIPAAPGEDMHLVELSANKLEIVWRMPSTESYSSRWLWEVFLIPRNLPPIENPTTVIKKSKHEHNTTLRVYLPYAYYDYQLKVRVQVYNGTVRDNMWSAPLIFDFRSKAKQPDRPPETNSGSFYIDSTETKVRIYWIQLQRFEYNGDNFTYVVSEVLEDGKVIPLKPLQLEMNSALFAWQKNSRYEFTICSRNSVGVSKKSSSIIILPLTTNDTRSHSPRSIHNIYHDINETYTITWEPPINTTNLRNYTVFWCQSKRALQNECNGSINFTVLENHIRKFTIESQGHSFNLAVSANYDTFNTGMHWTACTANEYSDLIRIEPEAEALSSTEIKVQWSPESICTSVLVGYNLTYCAVESDVSLNNDTCQNPRPPIKIDRDLKKWIIQDLEPFTNYKIQMYMYSKTKLGRPNDAIVRRTQESAPSPPQQLEVSDVTNVSATISWLPPNKPNGNIRFYEIFLNDELINKTVDIMKNAEGKIYFQLMNLASYTSYKVYVTAYTIESSGFSNEIDFLTKIGYPSVPEDVKPTDIKNNNTVITWQKPAAPAGRIEYYEVAVTQMSNDEIIHRRISTIIGSTSCSVKIPTCINHEYKTKFEVRAVNAAVLGSDVEYNVAFDYEPWDTDITNDKEYDELICTVENQESHNDILQRYQNKSEYRLFKSPWQPATTYFCSKNLLTKITAIIILSVIFSFLVMPAAYIAREKYNKMANIKCTLPAGLDMYLNKDGFTSEFRSNHLRVDNETATLQQEKEFVFHNEKHHLLSSMGNDSGFLCESGGRTLSGSMETDVTAHTDNGDDIAYFRSHSESSADSLVENSEMNEENLGGLQPLEMMQEELEKVAERNKLPEQQSQPLEKLNSNLDYIKPAQVVNWNSKEFINKNSITGVNQQILNQPYSQTNTDYVSVENIIGGMTYPNVVSTVPVFHDHSEPVPSTTNGYVQSQDIQNIMASNTVATAAAEIKQQPSFSAYTTVEELKKKFSSSLNDQHALEGDPVGVTGLSGYVTQRDLNAFGQQQNPN